MQDHKIHGTYTQRQAAPRNIIWPLAQDLWLHARIPSSLGRWLKVIDTQLTEDKIMATKIKRDEQSLRIVKETWGPILQRYSDLPNNWVYHREVLVGRSPRLA